MDNEHYRHWAHRAVDFTADYLDGLRERPVRPDVAPGETAALLPASPPDEAEPMAEIFADFERIVPGGLTNWQHPRFLAYFPANASRASMIAEHLATGIAVQCMLWETSPAATEMEARMVDWMRQAVGLPEGFSGTIQDTASSSTLCAVLTMRERALGWRGNTQGLSGQGRLRIYASPQNHSSIRKACWIAGIGDENLVSVETDDNFAMKPEALRAAIAADRAAGHLPAGVIAVVGGTGIGASDPVAEVLEIARAEGLYSHIDAAWAGIAMICPELRALWQGAEMADSIVLNPHKWLGAQAECSVQLLRDPADQVRTLGLRPDYLQTLGQSEIVNFSEWSPALGRRFRALKLWFVLRAYGLDGLRAMIRNHIGWAEAACERLRSHPKLEIVTEPRLSLFTFAHVDGEDATRALIEAINRDGTTYLTQTMHEGRFVIRFVVGQFDAEEADIEAAVAAIERLAG
ncbi:MAG: aspartate aminotransferase family protein [Alphaproteobacteria bacterium]|nr:MAG: aspartate aminotransferase family protein [Alphaproteobacteria bacterium]